MKRATGTTTTIDKSELVRAAGAKPAVRHSCLKQLRGSDLL